MSDLESPTCALGLREIRVIVRVKDNPTPKQLMEAVGMRVMMGSPSQSWLQEKPPHSRSRTCARYPMLDDIL